MAAPLPGFSEHPAVLDVEIGHRLGLRWFHLDETRHGHITVDHRIDQPVTLTCSCGDVITPSPDEVDPWWQRHNTRTTELTLKGVRDRWQPGENVAKCLATFDPYADRDYVSHGIPDEECGCGFWAYWNLGKQYVNPPTVAAIVKGYGDIIEGDLGFRCSHAQITALAPSVYSDALALTLETTWGVPVYSSVNAMLADSRNTPPQGQPALNGPELDNLAVLRRKRLAAWETCKAMADQAARKNRDFTPCPMIVTGAAAE